MTGWLILTAILMWISQTLFGLWQFKRFHHRVRELRKDGRVAIGKAKGRFLAGAVALICIDEKNCILHGEVMQGRTVFAGFRTLEELKGKYLTKLSDADCEGMGIQAQKAVLDARRDLEDYARLQAEKNIDDANDRPVALIPGEAVNGS